ncbi:WG repeat-containing protein [Shewanella corallii]|uniref:WG repeat-containing protein n=1 Tax=Shewanella corallii TaxID=560080 RepID=A0ABT0N1P3_9GAMM|nr:WG repeat-containing protein [Shewanella corallii]MCL2912359.1 WG repeat-containing protein [Shewanella corallii]
MQDEKPVWKTVTVPFHGELTLDIPIDSELMPWESEFYFWYIGDLRLTAENNPVYVIHPYNLDIVLSDAPEADFDYPAWRNALTEHGAEIIHEASHGVLYYSADALHVFTYLYTDKQHVLGKATLFDTGDLPAAYAAFEILHSFVPGPQKKQYTAPFNAAREMETIPHWDENPLALQLDDILPRQLTPSWLLKEDSLDGFYFYPDSFSDTVDAYIESDPAYLNELIASAKEKDWELSYQKEFVAGKQSGSLLFQSRRNPQAFISYCMISESGLNLLLSLPSSITVKKQMEFIHQCNQLPAGNRLPWLTAQWRTQLFKYGHVDPIDELPGWFEVFDKHNNPDDYFFGAAGLLNDKGEKILANRFEEIYWDDNFLIGKSKAGKELLDLSGKSLLKAEYFRKLYGSLYQIEEEDEKEGVYDIESRGWVIPLQKQHLSALDESGLFTFRYITEVKKYSIRYGDAGLIDAQGKTIVPNEYQTFWYNPGLKVIVAQRRWEQGDKAGYHYGIFDMQGNLRVPFEYDYVNGEETGAVIKLRKEGLWYQYPAE